MDSNDNNKVIRSASREVDRSEQPFSLTKLRERLLEAAGFSDTELGALTRASLNTLRDSLVATKVTPITFEGVVTDTHETIDHPTRVKAASTLLSVLGVTASKWNSSQETPKSGPIIVTVNVGGGDRLLTIDTIPVDRSDDPRFTENPS